MQDTRKKILFISDHPLAPSGVGTQAKYLIEGLLRTGKYRFLCFGGAIKHPDYRVQNVAPEIFGEQSWLILPVDGHGSKELLRKALADEKPDAVVIFTDPRFFYWIWEMEDEVRAVCPLLYWHVWDNDPTPQYNRGFYEATDFISALSLKTYGLLQDLKYPKDRFNYIPHAQPDGLFKPLPEEEVLKFKAEKYGPHGDPRRFIVFWSNRNARRKHPGDVLAAFKLFLGMLDPGAEASLMMHTNIHDQEGQDLTQVARCLGLEKNIIFSTDVVEPSQLNWFYNVADVTINVATNEGFGLTTLESLYAGTPIVANFTGGLQFQLGDWWRGRTDFSSQDEMTRDAKKSWNKFVSRRCEFLEGATNWWGAPAFPEVRGMVGSQATPYIYDDNVSNEQVAKALHQVYKLGRRRRKELGLHAAKWARGAFGMDGMIQSWDDTLERVITNHTKGSVVHTCAI